VTSRTGAGPRRGGQAGDAGSVRPGTDRPLAVTGAIAACAAAGTGLVALTMLVLVGWIAAPGAGVGLTGVLRTAALLWLIGHHVAFSMPGVGRIGMLPLGLVVLPGALLWRAGRWVVRVGDVRRVRHVGYAALALAVPYAMLAGALALASRSGLATPSLSEAVVCPFLLAFVAGGLGGARALAPWRPLFRVLPDRLRSLTVGATGALAVFIAAGALLAGASLALHLTQFRAVDSGLSPGPVGSGLLLLGQLGYVPNAVVWGIAFTLGPGFAFGAGTVIAPTGSALGPIPSLPMLAALPSGVHAAVPAPLSVAVLVVPYLAGAVGGLLVTATAPVLELQAAPLWGALCGALTGCVLAVMAAFAGGPLGDGRLSAVGPSAWQAGLIASLEVGVAAAVTAGVANWLRLGVATPAAAARLPAGTRLAGTRPASPAGVSARDVPRQAGRTARSDGDDDGHTIYLDPWAGSGEPAPHSRPSVQRGPSSLP
jgi:Family of unknown function (DUF6350)